MRVLSAGMISYLTLLSCGSGSGMESSHPTTGVGGSTATQAGPPQRRAPGPGRDFARRALLVGINDYSASQIFQKLKKQGRLDGGSGRKFWPTLRGAVNDVTALREMLVVRYGFQPEEIKVLTDQDATRQAILEAIEEHLIKPSGERDVALFYYAGHGSQVKNSLSPEPDQLDESIVPADSRRGAPDIHDKELRRILNRVLDRGARLTVILDSCNSGSGARGGLPTGAQPRGVAPDLRDVADGSNPPAPEDRGALVLSAAQDFERAWETRDERQRFRGAFSLALLRAMRDADPGEAAEATFLRARARLQAEKRFQQPVLAGNDAARQAPLLGEEGHRRAAHSLVAVESMGEDGSVVLQGGWANGLTVGSELLHRTGDGGEVRLEVTEVESPGRSKARVLPEPRRAPGALRARRVTLQAGALVEVASWAVPPGGPLRVWMSSTGAFDRTVELAQGVARQCHSRGVGWVEDPTQDRPTHVLRWRQGEWEVLAGERSWRLGPEPTVATVLEHLPPGSAVYAQLPAPAALVGEMTLGAGTRNDGIEATSRPDEADYVLVGRLSEGGVEYAWVRPDTGDDAAAQTALPVRTTWHSVDMHSLDSSRPHSGPHSDTALVLENQALQLRKLHAWHHLESPPWAHFPYRLVLHRESDGHLVESGTLAGGEVYALTLRAETPANRVKTRFIYLFSIDSRGKSVLLFPRGGSVENRFPPPAASAEAPSPAKITLGPSARFRVTEPYGVDTYFLLTSDESIPNPWVLEWNGVRTRGPRGETPLEELLSLIGGGMRSPDPLPVPAIWSLDRYIFESVPATADSGP